MVPNKKYRFRIINLSSHGVPYIRTRPAGLLIKCYILVHYKFSIDNHPLDVVAADGIPIISVAGVHQLPISIAQRVRGLCLPSVSYS